MKKKTRYLVSTLLAFSILVCSFGLIGCGGSGNSGLVSSYMMSDHNSFVPESYNTIEIHRVIATSLDVFGDGTYVLTTNTSYVYSPLTISSTNDIHYGGCITNTMYGTYTEEDGDDVVNYTLSVPTRLVHTSNVSVVGQGGHVDSANEETYPDGVSDSSEVIKSVLDDGYASTVVCIKADGMIDDIEYVEVP